ncbi:MAG: hypothetical protein IJI16_02525, partial [Atopobiaceae bacterium]|nr:hypothetical protein [Atopobiaceae bacterium]
MSEFDNRDDQDREDQQPPEGDDPFGGQDPFLPDPDGRRRRGLLYMLLIAAFVAFFVWSSNGQLGPNAEGNSEVEQLATSEFVTAVKEKRVSEVTYKASEGTLSGKYWADAEDVGNKDKLGEFRSTYVGADNLDALMNSHPSIIYRVDTTSTGVFADIMMTLIPTLIIAAIMFYVLRQMQAQNGQAMQFGKTKALTTEGTRPKKRFSDVAGIDEAVEELKEVRDSNFKLVYPHPINYSLLLIYTWKLRKII